MVGQKTVFRQERRNLEANIMTGKTVIYLRTSTEEQHPELQLKDCQTLLKPEWGEPEIVSEQQSAWKDKERPLFEKIRKGIEAGQTSHLVVWDLDRIYRVRKKAIEFMSTCRAYKCEIHSYRQEWLRQFDRACEQVSNVPEPWLGMVVKILDLMKGILLDAILWAAQEESDKKSARVKMAVERSDKGTYSKYGNKWGRKNRTIKKAEEAKKLHELGRSVRQISEELQISSSSVQRLLRHG